ncbi:hypothetical protein Cni_G01370 [Canna indica]|uniref:IBH1-like N-terminal domain-containing protein n=1 Tax=Canna indica TaxID=4628 RepID=A0AAQ3Q0Y8_9LILI|nr:hypothetical protein Cni_G01370 [Canna indica]
MEEKQGSKRRRVCSLEPNAVVYAGFLYKYIGYLLPALAKAATDLCPCHQTKERKIEKAVRFEVDMALVRSASGFKWSRALKRKLQHGNGESELCEPFTCRLIAKSFDSSMKSNVEKLHLFRPSVAVPRPLALVTAARPRKSASRRSYRDMIGGGRDDEFSRRMRTLRNILPGGREMCLSELLREAKSYMVCLQLQVNILRTLVEIH